jgi:hypothetical protein
MWTVLMCLLSISVSHVDNIINQFIVPVHFL